MATAYPSLAVHLSDKSHIHDKVVVSDNLITGNGPASSVQFACTLVEHLYGIEKWTEVEKMIAL